MPSICILGGATAGWQHGGRLPRSQLTVSYPTSHPSTVRLPWDVSLPDRWTTVHVVNGRARSRPDPGPATANATIDLLPASSHPRTVPIGEGASVPQKKVAESSGLAASCAALPLLRACHPGENRRNHRERDVLFPHNGASVGRGKRIAFHPKWQRAASTKNFHNFA